MQKKRILGFVMACVLLVGVIPMMPEARVTPQDVAAPTLVNTFHSVDLDSPMRKIEYYDITTNGMHLTVSGKCAKQYARFRVAVRTAEETKYLFYPESLGELNADGTFSKTLDFSELDPGKYLVSVRFNTDGSETFPKEAQMRYVPVMRTESGVFVEQYQAIERENDAIIRSNKNMPMYYLDLSMADMAHELRDGREYSKDDISELTTGQQQIIADFTKSVVGNEQNPYMQMVMIHDYLCENIYYDIPYNEASVDEKREMAENEEVMLNPYELAVELMTGNETKTVCNGFAALYAAMMRSLGIPSRTARGKSLRIPGAAWNELTDEQLQTTTHVWNEFYIDGRWIFADATRDCSNDYTADGEYILKSDEIVRYSGLDPSAQAIAVAIVYSSYRESIYAPLQRPMIKKIENRYEPIEVEWSPVQGAVSYKLYRSKGEGYYENIATLKDTKFTDQNLNAGTTYYYKVAAVDENNIESRRSDFKSVNVTEIPQTAITNIDSENGEVNISFQGITDVMEYNVYRSTSKNGTYSLVDSVESDDLLVTFTDDTEFTYGKTYYYKVRGIRGMDRRAPLSEPVSVQAAMVTPELISVSSKYRQVTLRWEETEQATRYYIYRGRSKDGEFELVDSVDGDTTVYRSGILTADTKYFWKISARSTRDTRSELSEHKAITVKDTPTPELRSVSNKDRVVTLRWYKLKDAVRYYVYRSTDGESYTRITKVPGNELFYRSAKLKSGKKYYWMVKAVMTTGAITDYSDYKVITAKKKEKEKEKTKLSDK